MPWVARQSRALQGQFLEVSGVALSLSPVQGGKAVVPRSWHPGKAFTGESVPGKPGWGCLRPAEPTGVVFQDWWLLLQGGSRRRGIPGRKGQERVGRFRVGFAELQVLGYLQIGGSDTDREWDRRIGVTGLRGTG